MKKKILALCLVVCLAVMAIAGASLAYFTDTDSDVNVMTTGNVKIDQLENGQSEDGFVKADLLPGGEKLAKEVTVKNTGNQPAYIRTLFAFEDTRDLCTAVHYDCTEAFNFPSNDVDNWLQIEVTKDGVSTVYTVGYYVYKGENGDGIIAPNDITEASMKSIWLDTSADNNWSAVAGDTYEVLVLSQACQTTSFTSAEEALNATFGEITVISDDLVAGWFDEMLGEGYTVTGFNYVNNPWSNGN